MVDCGCREGADHLQRKTLLILIAINGLMFLVEATIGWLAESAGLLSDSLDMLADALVYGTALYAVGRTARLKSLAASTSGWIQIALGIGVLLEIVRRLIQGSDPVSLWMISIGSLALIANVACLLLLAKHRHEEAHMRASWIFSTNDVIANIGVVLSGLLVMVTGSRLPDLLIGTLVAIIVIRGGRAILRDAKL